MQREKSQILFRDSDESGNKCQEKNKNKLSLGILVSQVANVKEKNFV